MSTPNEPYNPGEQNPDDPFRKQDPNAPTPPPYGSAPEPGAPQYGSPQYGAPQGGAPQYGAPQYGAPQYPGGGTAGYAAPPQNYLVWAILSTLFCCLPLGIVSIVFAAQVNSKYAAGDVQGALDSSQKAKKFAIWSAIAGVVVGIIYGILIAVGAMSSDTSSSF